MSDDDRVLMRGAIGGYGFGSERLLPAFDRLCQERDEGMEAKELLLHRDDKAGSIQWHASYRRMWGEIDKLKADLAASRFAEREWHDKALELIAEKEAMRTT